MPASPTRAGDRVILDYCSDEGVILYEGEKGTVKFIDSHGAVHVQWDNDGETIALVPGEDSWRVLKDETDGVKGT
jgi:hypothetical protein